MCKLSGWSRQFWGRNHKNTSVLKKEMLDFSSQNTFTLSTVLPEDLQDHLLRYLLLDMLDIGAYPLL